MKTLLIGPGTVGTPYGTALSDLLGTRGLTEAIIASAFLTEAGAERLIDAVRRERSGATITVIVGSMAGFTRKAAIRYLQSFITGKNRKLVVARLRLVHPFEAEPRNPCFHAKVAYGRVGTRRHLAIIGSHNLTTDGLESYGELGVAVDGLVAKSIGRALQHWLARGTMWSEYLRRYKQAKRIPGIRRQGRHGGESRAYGEAGPLLEMEALSADEERLFDRLCAEHDAVHGDDPPAALTTKADALPAGAVFDSVDYSYPDDGSLGWTIGAQRGIARTVRFFPDTKSRQGLLVYQWLKRYRVTDRAIRIAKECGVFDNERPTGAQLWKFERKLREENVPGWN